MMVRGECATTGREFRYLILAYVSKVANSAAMHWATHGKLEA